MTDWSRLNHAYGTAQDIPGLLDAMSPDPQDAGWGALWSRLCHQGTVYSAGYAALPALAAMARQWSAAERSAPLCLAGAIVASVDRPDNGEDPYLSRSAATAELRGLTEEALRDPGLTGDPLNYVQLLGTLLSFEGVEVWGEQIDGLNGGEYELPCPACEAENFVVFGEHGCFSTMDAMYMERAPATRFPLRPMDPSLMDGLAGRLYARMIKDGHPDLAHKLTYVFGRAQCADCGVSFSVEEAVFARWGA
ncbi:hypothetical protein [Streptomyces sp. OR43]|uniref:hypothetical protein n=1 Tax=Streptomyces sp. or43 TaxID=2478957 RepID=UPI0011CE18AC|nr:hypothetical protein [Streptomyces sp. or43]TXS37227.1 hypothetical protein EAO72_28230 [Streptomyces sp. or43]